jgi:hypothetical protein
MTQEGTGSTKARRPKEADPGKAQVTDLGVIFFDSGDSGNLRQRRNAARIVSQSVFVGGQCKLEVVHLFRDFAWREKKCSDGDQHCPQEQSG